MKIVVFGGAGWLGRATLSNLEGAGHQVRAFDHTEEAWAAWEDVDGRWEGDRIFGDIVDYDQVQQAIAGCDAVIHVAVWFPQGGEQDRTDEKAFLVNLKGLWNVLEASRRVCSSPPMCADRTGRSTRSQSGCRRRCAGSTGTPSDFP
jgi:nucleoside-diphosphate-sugar epimerase